MAGTDGKPVALVTGAGRGIGRDIALGLTRAGFALCMVARNREDLLDTRRLSGLAPEDSLIILLDLAQPEAPETLMTAAIDHFGRIDALVNNAHFAPQASSLIELDPEGLDRAIALNLRAPIVLARLAAAMMAPRGGGTIINIVRGGSRTSSDHGSVYAASCSGLLAFTRSAHAELRRQSIKLCAMVLAPGPESSPVVPEMVVRTALAPLDAAAVEIEVVEPEGS
ncbi:MAG TPA: SDR family NAD(P)-dependent oxidoreductase [Candidatus Binataceae bacterium]|nr:SDR family NAD(P)-dependent oxidoreductase [Candidatus Binataceae bacterium]